MRRYLVLALGLSAALIVCAAALAAGKTTQKIDASVAPSNLPDQQRAGVTLRLSETTGTTDPSGVQPPTASAKVFLDKDILITYQGLPNCTAAQTVGKSTEEARKNCRTSLVGTGSAVARTSNGAGGHIDLPAVVSVFNARSNGRPIMVLHVVIGDFNTDVVLLIKHHAGAYGTELATGAGAAQPIRSISLTLHRAFTVHGERRNYISARCSHDKLLYKATFTYTEGPPLTATDSQNCS
jgi:hypothetical protein